MLLLNLKKFEETTLVKEPFEHLIVPEFILPEAMPTLLGDYPQIAQGGSFPLSQVDFGPSFELLCDQLMGEACRRVFAEKFNLDLTERPTTLTVRGKARRKDGKIHTDSKSKLVTVLIYMNGPWEDDGGRLRLLRDGTDLDNYFAEVPPEQGTMLCFKNQPNAWHGHKSFEGTRRVIQLNWVTDESAVLKSEARHGTSAWLKKWNPFKGVA